jgi:hypothetical protein
MGCRDGCGCGFLYACGFGCVRGCVRVHGYLCVFGGGGVLSTLYQGYYLSSQPVNSFYDFLYILSAK